MAEYTITQVSQKPPRTWSFTDKRTGADVPMETYKVMFGGHDEPVDINRKPGKAPTVGEVLTGSIEPTDFGFKFKPDRKPGTAWSSKDQESIRAQWAIGQAVAVFNAGKDTNIGDIEKNAKDFYAMVDRVKGGVQSEQPPASEPGYEKAKAEAERIRQTFSDGSPTPSDADMQINLDNIPF